MATSRGRDEVEQSFHGISAELGVTLNDLPLDVPLWVNLTCDFEWKKKQVREDYVEYGMFYLNKNVH